MRLRVTHIILSFTIAATVCACTSVKTSEKEQGIVQLKSGKISGILLDSATNLRAFKGIPYAEPPLGALRWKAPRPVQNWDNVLACTNFSKWCPQRAREAYPYEKSEDCLCLNVWTDNIGGNEKLPVLVWIHGGGLSTLASNYKPFVNGVTFAKKGIILVSINYRLGALGFLAHPGLSAESENNVSGNYGYLDQLEALRWVQENIASFGGDPDNVTIFGNSAGGTSVATLCASPLSKGLFHKAIMQSPWMFGGGDKKAVPNIARLRDSLASLPSAEQLGTVWAQTFVNEGEDALKKLRSLDVDQIINEVSFQTKTTIDGWFLHDYPEAVFRKGNQMDIPVIIGSNKEEGNYYLRSVRSRTQEEFTERISGFYKGAAADISGFYSFNSEEEAKIAVGQYITDAWFLEPADHLVQEMENVTSPAYQYEFVVPLLENPSLGAVHASEIQYVYNQLGSEASEEVKTVGEAMISYWTQFAKTGNPNQPGLPQWEAYTKNQKSYLEIGKTITPKTELLNAARRRIREEKVRAYERATQMNNEK
ncbi:MAG: carboxylesterase family protein [Bacteroidota bacterium]